MSDHTLFADLDAHQRLMESLEQGANEVHSAAETINRHINDLRTHNLDNESHPALTRRISLLEEKTTSSVDDRISEHNESSYSHPQLVATLRKEMSSNEDMKRFVTTAIDAHNNNDLGHPQIREAINKLQNQVGSTNLSEVNNRIKLLEDGLVEINGEVVSLQNTDAEFRAQFENVVAENNQLRTLIGKLQQDLNYLTSTDDEGGGGGTGVGVNSEVLEKLMQVIAKYEAQSATGIQTFNPNGPIMDQFRHSLPVSIKRSGSVDFAVWGAQPRIPDGETPDATAHVITYDFEITQGNGVLSKMQNVEAEESIHLSIGDDMQSGSMMVIVCRAVDRTSLESTAQILVISVAKSPFADAVTLLGIPDLVDPGFEYDVTIRNVLDDTKIYRYSFDPGSTGITFTPASGIKTGDVVKMHIPESAPYDAENIIELMINDSVNDPLSKNVIIRTSTSLTADDFTSNTPAIMVPGKMVYVKFTGAGSDKGLRPKYRVDTKSSEFIFVSKATDILDGENIKLTLTQDAVRGQAYSFDVYAYLNEFNTVKLEQTVKANVLPTSGSIVTTLPASSRGGQTVSFTISGGDDPDKNFPLTYSIDSGTDGLAFSKIAGITLDEPITVQLPKVSAEKFLTFKIYAVDALGERSALGKEIIIKALPLWKASPPTITSPRDGEEVNYDFIIQWTEFQMYPDMS